MDLRMSFVDYSMRRIQGSDKYLRAFIDNPFIHRWGSIIHGCGLSTNGVQHMGLAGVLYRFYAEMVELMYSR